MRVCIKNLHHLLEIKMVQNFILLLSVIWYTTALDHTNSFWYTGMCPVHSPLLGHTRILRTSNINQVFHFKVITSQDVRTCFAIHTTLSFALTNTTCEGFYITLSFYPLSYFSLFFMLLFYNST